MKRFLKIALIVIVVIVVGAQLALVIPEIIAAITYNADPPPAYEPPTFEGKLTVHFYDENGELITSYTCRDFKGTQENSDEIKKNIPSTDKSGYDFLYWDSKVNNEGEFFEVIDDFKYETDKTNFNELIKKTREEDGEKHIYLYQFYKIHKLAIEFSRNGVDNGSGIESISTYIHREDGERTRFECTTFDLPRAPGGYGGIYGSSGKEVVGWMIKTNSFELMVYDYAGNLLITPEELYGYAKTYGPLEFAIHTLKLKPVFAEKFSILTFDFVAEELDDEFCKLAVGDAIESVVAPTPIYSSLGLFAGWSLDKEELVPVEGVATEEDVTAYALWTPAKRISVHAPGKEDPVSMYVRADGSVVGKLHPDLHKFDVESWFSDAERSIPAELSFDNISEDDSFYVTLVQTRKEVTLAPKNGDAAYKALVSISGEPVALPEWPGYEIEGWYESPNYDGDAVSLDYESVTDGATYYAKWVKKT